MKHLILSVFLLLSAPLLLAETSTELQITGDQLYEDGFTAMAW